MCKEVGVGMSDKTETVKCERVIELEKELAEVKEHNANLDHLLTANGKAKFDLIKDLHTALAEVDKLQKVVSIIKDTSEKVRDRKLKIQHLIQNIAVQANSVLPKQKQ